MRRLEKRSMTSARAAIEQISSGQMGQPAACMIESNTALSVGRRRPCRKKARIMACRRRASNHGRVGRDIPDDGAVSSPQGAAFNEVENFVDKRVCQRLPRLVSLGTDPPA
ncbi:MAG TPA: hypothetical protein VFF43_05125 [Caldimonas sp.]|nr:hypothetical protein [Caldimonas sp.]